MNAADESAIQELLELEDFRRDRFAALGCDEKQAQRAAKWKIDWHDFEDLRLRDCSVEDALRILRPLQL